MISPQVMGRTARMSKLVNATGLLAVSAAVLECTAPTRPEWLLVRGYIEAETLGEVLVLPDTVQVDRAFGAVVTTLGSSTCRLRTVRWDAQTISVRSPGR